MALIKCPECGKEISDNAKTCPNCGRALKPSAAVPILLGISCLLAALVIAFFLPSYLNPESIQQATVFRTPYLITLIIAAVSLVSAVLGFINIKVKQKGLAFASIACSIICFALLAYGFSLTTEFFLMIPFILGAAVLTLIASCLSLKTL
jgi:peptidoglycan/LPS O-acetylase OafA/YrhL